MTNQEKFEYPSESQHMDILAHLEELRRRLLVCLGVWGGLTVAAFSQAKFLVLLTRQPLRELLPTFIFISPAEAFLAYLKISLLAGFLLTFPVFLYEGWMFLSPALPVEKRPRLLLWLTGAVACFVLGLCFAFFGALPGALRFLLTFSDGVAVPQITLEHYVSFFVAFVLIGGLVFEIPVVMGLLADLGFLKAQPLRAQRKYAILVIMIVAAVITPTQDVFNMLIFAVPMWGLYELGILLVGLVEKNSRT